MNNDFIKIEMYQCIWCGKIFKTDIRHKCMYNPKNRNCFSCKHCTGFDSFKGQYGDFARCEVPPYDYFECDSEETIDTDYPDFHQLHNRKWIGNCPYYEIKDEYKGKESYAKLFKDESDNFREENNF